LANLMPHVHAGGSGAVKKGGHVQRRAAVRSPPSPPAQPVAPLAGFCCPIGLHPMFDPVTISTGRSFERHMIRRALDIAPRDPVSNEALASTELTTNFALRDAIMEYYQREGAPPKDWVECANSSKDPTVLLYLARNCGIVTAHMLITLHMACDKVLNEMTDLGQAARELSAQLDASAADIYTDESPLPSIGPFDVEDRLVEVINERIAKRSEWNKAVDTFKEVLRLAPETELNEAYMHYEMHRALKMDASAMDVDASVCRVLMFE